MKPKIILPLIFVLALAGMVWATTATIVSPLSSGRMDTTTYNFNVSVSDDNVTNCTVTGSSSKNGGSWTIYVYNATDGKSANATIDTTAQNDSNDWTFTAVCVNSTPSTIATSAAVSSVIVDNTIPSIRLNAPTDNSEDSDGLITFNVTCGNATSATLKIGSADAQSMTRSGLICYNTMEISLGKYQWTVDATDGTNTTTSSTWTVTQTKGRDGGIIPEHKIGQKKETNTMVALAVILALVFFFGSNSKGRKKR